jgi:hypothetical protein
MKDEFFILDGDASNRHASDAGHEMSAFGWLSLQRRAVKIAKCRTARVSM